EEALTGNTAGIAEEEAYGVFKYDALSTGYFGRGGYSPWGWDKGCGTLQGPDALPAQDMLDQPNSYFIREYDEAHGSVYDLERDLAAGVESLRGKGLTVGQEGTVDGQEAFAYLVAANIANQVWSTGTGYDLTIAHMFPRNQSQMRHLERFADIVATSG